MRVLNYYDGSDLNLDDLELSDDDTPVTGFAVASNKRNGFFMCQKYAFWYPSFLTRLCCALQRDIQIRGRLYISENHMIHFSSFQNNDFKQENDCFRHSQRSTRQMKRGFTADLYFTISILQWSSFLKKKHFQRPVPATLTSRKTWTSDRSGCCTRSILCHCYNKWNRWCCCSSNYHQCSSSGSLGSHYRSREYSNGCPGHWCHCSSQYPSDTSYCCCRCP